jgi:hypothetical protein
MMELNIDCADDWILDLLRDTGSTPQELLEDAMGLLSWVVQEQKRGRKIISCDDWNENALMLERYYRGRS